MSRAACLLFAFAAIFAAQADGAAAVQVIRGVQFLPGEAVAPPSAQAPGWSSRSLPDDWSLSQPGVGGEGWYRARFDLPAVPAELWAVYLPRLRMNAAVYVNGRFLGDGGRFAEPVARNWNRPLYFPIPAELLHAGANTLDLRIAGSPNVHAGLFGLEAGPDALLRPAYERRFFLKVTLNQALFVSTLLMALLMGTLWLRRRQDSIYGWFALTSLLWAAHSTHFFVRDLPLDTWQWEWFAQASTDWFAVLLAILVHRYYGLRRRRLEWLMLAYAIVSAAVLAGFDLGHMFVVANTLHAGAVVIGTYVVLLAAHRAWQARRSDEIVLALGFGAQSALGLHDWLLQLGVWDQNRWYLMHYGSSALFLMLAWLLSSRFVRSLGETEVLNAELEQRVEQKHRELESSYRDMQQMQRAQVVAEERERIMRDLHDGLGGQLVSALAIAQRGGTGAVAMQQTLRDALDDLRLVIDSLDPAEGDLLVLLGTVRGRLEPRLLQQGLRFEWQVRDLPPIPDFSPDKALQVLRIVQEAIANILKHASASTVTVRTGREPPAAGGAAGVFIDIIDDGVGMAAAGTAGRGLGNMRSRAARIGGRLEVESRPRGTAVRLWLPLPEAA